MANRQCIICKRKFYDRHMDWRDICNRCGPKFDKDLKEKVADIEESMSKVTRIKSPHIKLAEYGEIINAAEALTKYETKDFEVLPGSAKYLADYYRRLQKNLITHALENEIKAYLKKTNDLKTEKGKLNNLSKLRLEILKYQDAASFYKAPLKRHLRLILDKIRLQEFTYQGKRFANAGQLDKSVKLFEKALDQIYKDDVDDKYQQKEIAIIKRAIKKLAKSHNKG